MSTVRAFGTYIPRQTFIHQFRAQVKILLTCAFCLAVFFLDGWPGLLIAVLLTVMLYQIARIPLSSALRGLKPIIFILAFTLVAHAFAFDVNASADFANGSLGSLGLQQRWAIVGNFGVTLDGLVEGLYFALRIALLVAFCSLLTFTTSITELTDGLISLLSPLRVIRVPVDDVAMIISIALRFIPTTADEALVLVNAQKARGVAFETGGPFHRIHVWVPILVPLIVRLFRRAEDLAEAMDARSYGVAPRTHMNRQPMRASDIVALVIGVAACVALCVFL
ncbi:MAG: energy-coupling factor transporter transmembrane protein EcfT [Coriobacteriaceae bacterium]|nr:energy-coupling factor transporter transmembrane protein EcfT [Coriobacteriaceae bacterium]